LFDFWMGHIAMFSIFLVFLFGISASLAKSLGGNFNHMWCFYWNILNVLAGLCSGKTEVLSLTTDWEHSQPLPHAHCTLALLWSRKTSWYLL
jgi:hypothetical protein